MLERRVAVFVIFASFFGVNSQENVEVTCHVNGKKSIQCVSEKFLSISIDPAVLLAGVNLSESSLLLAQHLSPAYIRIAGPSTKFIKYFDEGVLLPTDTNSVPVTPATWFAVNEWLRLAGLQPVYGINDVEEQKGLWDPRGALSLLELSDKLNVTGYWQLGFDTSNKSELKYKQDLDLFRSVLDGFPDKNEIWKIVGSDISVLPKPENTISELKNILDTAMWEPRGMTEATFPEKEGAYKIIQNQKLGKTGVKLWTCVPKASTHITFASALVWAEQLGQAAKIGYDAVFRQPRMYELFASTPVYWLSALHKKLMGTNVLEAKTATNQPGVDVFAHCSRNQNSFIRRGALTLMTVNRNSDEVTFKVKFGVPQSDKTMEVQYYILTAPSLNSSDMFLNDNLLTPEILADKDPFKPKLRRAKTPSYIPLTVPASSIAFFVLPGAKIPVCVEDEVETNMLLEEMEEDQKALLSEEIALKLGPRGSFGGNLVLEEITKQIKQEMESDEKYYHDKLTTRFVETKDESKNAAKEDEEVVNRRRKYFIDRAKLSEKRRKAPSFETKKDDFKKFLLEKSKTAKPEAKPASKSTQMELTSGEVENILRSRAKARAAQRNIIFTDTELNALVHKAKKKFYSDKIRRKRSTNQLLLDDNHIRSFEATDKGTNQLIMNRLRGPTNDVRYYGDEDETKSNRIKMALRNKRDINQLMLHRVTNADNLIQNKEKREELKQTKKMISKNKRDIEKKRLGIEARIAEKKHNMRVKKQVLKGRMREKKGQSRAKREVSMFVKMNDKLKLDNQALRDKLGQKLNNGKRSKRGTERFAEAKEKLRMKKQALKDRMKETLNNIRRSKRDIKSNHVRSSKRDIKKLAGRKEMLREKKQAMRDRMKERLNSVRRSRRDINMDMVNEHGKKKSKKQKIIKEATMRKPGQTSAEILADLEAEEKAREMEDKPPEMKTEIFAQMADDEEEEEDMFDVTPKRKQSGIFKKKKKDPLAFDIVEPHSKNQKSRKHQPKADELQFLTASEEFTDVEEYYPCIHEFFTGKEEPVQKVQKKTNMELGEYTAKKIKAGRKQEPGLWEESAGFRKRRSTSEEELKVEGLDVPQDNHEEQQKSSEKPGSAERHLFRRDVNTKGSTEESNFKSMYGMPKSEIARRLANLNRVMSLNKINPDVLKKRMGNTEEKEQQSFPLVAVEEKNRRGMLRQLDKLRKKIQRRKNDIDKLLTKEAKKYGEIFPEQAGLLGNNLLTQFSRDLGKELSITKDLIRTQIPLEKKMKEYSYKLKEISDRNAKLGALLTSRSYSKPVSSSEESGEARSKSRFDEDLETKTSKITESKEQRKHHSDEESKEKSENTTENFKPILSKENGNQKVSLLLTRTGAVLQGDHLRTEQGRLETKNPTFSSRIGMPVNSQGTGEKQEDEDEVATFPKEEVRENKQKSHSQLQLDHLLLETRMEKNEGQEKELVKSREEQENGHTSMERQIQELSIPTEKTDGDIAQKNQTSNHLLELDHPMLMTRMGDAFDQKELEQEHEQTMPVEEHIQELPVPMEEVGELSLPREQEREDDIPTEQNHLELDHPMLMTRMGDAFDQKEQEQEHKQTMPVEEHIQEVPVPMEKVGELSLPTEQEREDNTPTEQNNQQLHSRPEPDFPLLKARMGSVEQQNKETFISAGQQSQYELEDNLLGTTKGELSEKTVQQLTTERHVLNHGRYNEESLSQDEIRRPVVEALQTTNYNSSSERQMLEENEGPTIRYQSQDNPVKKEYDVPLEQPNGLHQSSLEDKQKLYVNTIEKQLNDQLEMLLMGHNEQLGSKEFENHLTSNTEMVQSHQQSQSDKNTQFMENLEEIPSDDYITTAKGHRIEEPNFISANGHSAKFSSIEEAIVGATPLHLLEKPKNDEDLVGELMENEKLPTTLKPPILEKVPESVHSQDSSEYIVHNILSQMSLSTENSVTAAPEDIFKKFVEAMKGDDIEVNTERPENRATDKLQVLNRKKRHIIGDERFGDYRPLSKNLKKWKPSDILSLKKNMSSFKTLRPPPNDFHIFKSALEHNKVRILRRSLDFDVNDVENRLDRSDFSNGMFENKARDIFKTSKKFQNRDAMSNTIVKVKFEESPENNRRNEIRRVNKYEQFLKDSEVKDRELTRKMNEMDHRKTDRDNNIKINNGISHIQMIKKDYSDGDKTDNIRRIEKNKAKTKLFERFVANLSGFLTNIGKQVGMYVKKINI